MSEIKKNDVNKKKKPKTPAKVTVLEGARAPVQSPKFRFRHFLTLVSFGFLVLGPTAFAVYYLFVLAEEQYSSRVSFSIRSEEVQAPLDALGSLGSIGTGTASDASILNEYLRSQSVIEDIVKELDLISIYSKPTNDPIFGLQSRPNIEELVEYFNRMNYVSFDSANGLIDVQSFAFTAEDAHSVANAILLVSRRLVEKLSSIAQEDTTRNAKIELENARSRLLEIRQELSILRETTQTIDPSSELQSQMGVLTALQNQLANTMVEYDLLIATTREGDARVLALLRTIEAIEGRISQERSKIGSSSNVSNESLSSLVGDFETLVAEREFAEASYLAARTSFDTAVAEARRKSKYLAAHIPPTLAESSQYPRKLLWISSIFGICLVFWSIIVLSAYALMDRK